MKPTVWTKSKGLSFIKNLNVKSITFKIVNDSSRCVSRKIINIYSYTLIKLETFDKYRYFNYYLIHQKTTLDWNDKLSHWSSNFNFPQQPFVWWQFSFSPSVVKITTSWPLFVWKWKLAVHIKFKAAENSEMLILRLLVCNIL